MLSRNQIEISTVFSKFAHYLNVSACRQNFAKMILKALFIFCVASASMAFEVSINYAFYTLGFFSMKE